MSKLPSALQYSIEKSPEPRQYQTDIDSSLPVDDDDTPTDTPTLQTDNMLAEQLPDITKEELIPDDIFDKIQKKLVKEKKKLTQRKPAPQTRRVKEDESDYQVSSDDEETKQIKQAYVKFTEEAPPPKKKPMRSLSPPAPIPEGVKLTKSGKPRKQLSEEAKERRRLALEKGRETRRRNMLARKGIPLKKETSPIPIPKKKVERPQSPPKAKMWTTEDLARSQFEAIERYDTMRKERKQKKKEAKAIEEQRQQIKQVVHREAQWQMKAGRFAGCY